MGEKTTNPVTEINTLYEGDNEYVFSEDIVTSEQISYFYSYLPEISLDVPFRAFAIELDSSNENVFTRVDCAFVYEDEDTKSMA